MSNHLYSVGANGRDRLVMADDPMSALRLALADDAELATAKDIMLSRRDDVLRGASKPRALPIGEKPAAPKGMVLVSVLAAELDMTHEGIKYRMKKHGIKGVRVAGSGRPLAVTQKDADKLSAD
jgi:hypothetical protein